MRTIAGLSPPRLVSAPGKDRYALGASSMTSKLLAEQYTASGTCATLPFARDWSRFTLAMRTVGLATRCDRDHRHNCDRRGETLTTGGWL